MCQSAQVGASQNILHRRQPGKQIAHVILSFVFRIVVGDERLIGFARVFNAHFFTAFGTAGHSGVYHLVKMHSLIGFYCR